VILNRYSWQELADYPTECVGQTDNLKLDTGKYRWWLARTTLEDGDISDHRVSVEEYNDGRWTTIMDYDGETLEILS
jgi:hypothetical protein